MAVAVKICGLSTIETVAVAVEAGARFVGFVFYPRSPRAVSLPQPARLAAAVPASVRTVGLFVNPDRAEIEAAVSTARLDLIQLHGTESPEQCAQIRERLRRPVIKAVGVASAADLAAAERYNGAVDWLMFDAKPPATPTALPGGNGVAFDWDLLAGRTWPVPWMLSGGLTPETVGQALRRTRPDAVDVSSGVEASPGIKDPARIRAFLAAVAAAG